MNKISERQMNKISAYIYQFKRICTRWTDEEKDYGMKILIKMCKRAVLKEVLNHYEKEADELIRKVCGDFGLTKEEVFECSK